MAKRVRKKYGRPRVYIDTPTHYCPGCSHGIIHKLIAEVIGELDIQEITIGVAPVGCAVYMYNYMDIDMTEAAHGRAPAVATGIKRVLPDRVVFTYQGDGDLAAIGTNEIIHACARGENITVFFVNNAIYGMTGGQMAPTTLFGQKTTSSPYGRNTNQFGFPLRITELLAQIPGSTYVTRQAVNSPGAVRKTRQAIKRAFLNQIYHGGLSLVEIVSTCPTNWGLTPVEALKWLKQNMLSYYKLGDLKIPEGGM